MHPDESQLVCRNCGTRLVGVPEEGQSHRFCGQACSTEFEASQEIADGCVQLRTLPDSGQCALEGCRLPVCVEEDGTPSLYCSQRHRQMPIDFGPAEACLLCEGEPKANINYQLIEFCWSCRRHVTEHGPRILQIPPKHQVFHSVANRFWASWTHSTPVPVVVKVWRIHAPHLSDALHDQYRLGDEHHIVQRYDRNTSYRWLGTIRDCNLGDDDHNKDLCSSSACRLCQIIRLYFQSAKEGQSNVDYGQFEKGIYTSAASSKVISNRATTKAVLLDSSTARKTSRAFMKPRGNAGSVIEELGANLDYDERVAYDDFFHSLYLVIYRD